VRQTSPERAIDQGAGIQTALVVNGKTDVIVPAQTSLDADALRWFMDLTALLTRVDSAMQARWVANQ